MVSRAWCATLSACSCAFLAFFVYHQSCCSSKVHFPSMLSWYSVLHSMIVRSWKDSSLLRLLYIQYGAVLAVSQRRNSKGTAKRTWFWFGPGLFVRAISWPNGPEYMNHAIWSETKGLLFFFFRNPMTCGVTQPSIRSRLLQAAFFCFLGYVSVKQTLSSVLFLNLHKSSTNQADCFGVVWKLLGCWVVSHHKKL